MIIRMGKSKIFTNYALIMNVVLKSDIKAIGILVNLLISTFLDAMVINLILTMIFIQLLM